MRLSFLASLVASFVVLVLPLGSAATVTVSPNGPLASIQQGVAAALAGDKVVVKAGVYSGSVNIPAGKDGLRIQASGKVVLDVAGPGATNFGSGIVINSANVTIKGLTIRNALLDPQNGSIIAAGIRILATGARIENCKIVNTGSDGIAIAADGARIKKCAIAGTDGAGAFITAAADTQLTSTSFRQTHDEAIVTDDVCAGIVVEACSFEQIEDNGAINAGVVSPGLVVRKCKFRHCSIDAIDVNGPIEITNNKIEDCGGGFDLADSIGRVEKNVIKRLRDSTAAIFVSGDAVALDVTNNTVQDCLTEGLIIETDSGSCSVRNLRVVRCGSRSAKAVDIQGAGHTLDDVRVSQSFDDAFAIGGSNHVLTGCVVKDAVRDGFDVAASATGIVLEGCRAEGCLAEGFENSGTNTSLVGCIAKKNRIDLANNGSFGSLDLLFSSGSQAQLPEID